MERWQNKIRRLRRFLRGWARNLVSQNKKQKSNLLANIDVLDRKAETCLLCSSSRRRRLASSMPFQKPPPFLPAQHIICIFIYKYIYIRSISLH